MSHRPGTYTDKSNARSREMRCKAPFEDVEGHAQRAVAEIVKDSRSRHDYDFRLADVPDCTEEIHHLAGDFQENAVEKAGDPLSSRDPDRERFDAESFGYGFGDLADAEEPRVGSLLLEEQSMDSGEPSLPRLPQPNRPKMAIPGSLPPAVAAASPCGRGKAATSRGSRMALIGSAHSGFGTVEVSRMAACLDLNSAEVMIPKATASRVMEPARNWRA